LYQTLDAIDGKHARSLGLSSPIGQLLDHGLDSFSASIFTITSMVTLGLSSNSTGVWILTWVNISYMFLANAEEFYTKVMRTNVNGLGVTEVQLLLIAGLLIQGTYVLFFPNSQTSFFERKMSVILFDHFGYTFPANSFGSEFYQTLDITLLSVFNFGIAMNGITSVYSFLMEIYQNTSFTCAEKLKNMTGYFLINIAGKILFYL
jgi:phosphatidylglycerophosphate synthase